MPGGYGDSFYESVTVGINATGTAGVQALDQAVQDARAELAKFQAQVQAGGPITAKQVAEAAQLTAAVDKATEAFAAAQRVIAGLPAKLQASGNAMRGATDAALQLSRGIEDLATGGPIGILNNLPGIARGIGTAFGAAAPQIAIAEAAVGAAGTAAYLLYQNFDKIRSVFGSGNAFGQLPSDVDGLMAKLKELNAIKIKTAVDYRDIDIAQEHLDRLTEGAKGYDRLKNKKSKAQQEAGERATEAIVEFGGGTDYESGVDKVAGVVAQHTAVIESTRTAELAEQARRVRTAAESSRRTPGGGTAAAALFDQLADIEKQLKTSRGDDQTKHLVNVREMFGRASEGRSNDIDAILKVIREHQGEVAKAGISEGFVQKFGGATRGRVERDASDKLGQADAKKAQAEVEKAIDESAQETELRVRDAIRSVRAGVDDGLEKGVQDAMKGGATRAEAMAKVRTGLLDTLRKRGVGGYDISEVADQLIGSAADKVENNIQEGAEPKLDVKKKRDDDKAKTQRDQAVSKAVSSVGAGYSGEAERAMYDAIKGGADPNAVGVGEHRLLTKALRERGDVAPELVDEVAARILDKAKTKALSDLDSGQKPAAIAKDEREAAAAAKKSGFLPELEARIARNRQFAQQGAPVPRNRREMERFDAFGQPYALPEAEMRRQLTSEVGRNLRAGGGDPRHAAGIVGVAAGHVDETFQRDMAQLGNGVLATQAVVNQTQGQVGAMQGQMQTILGGVDRLKKNGQALQAGFFRLHNRARQTQQRRPSLLSEGDNF